MLRSVRPGRWIARLAGDRVAQRAGFAGCAAAVPACLVAFAAAQPSGTVPPEQRDVVPSETAYRSSEGRLRKQLFVVHSHARRPLPEIKAVLARHLEYLAGLEREGLLFMAGPLMNEDPQTWSGDGLLVFSAASYDEALRLAEGDPLHAAGVRSFTLRPWILNDGSLTLTVRLSTQEASLP